MHAAANVWAQMMQKSCTVGMCYATRSNDLQIKIYEELKRILVESFYKLQMILKQSQIKCQPFYDYFAECEIGV